MHFPLKSCLSSIPIIIFSCLAHSSHAVFIFYVLYFLVLFCILSKFFRYIIISPSPLCPISSPLPASPPPISSLGWVSSSLYSSRWPWTPDPLSPLPKCRDHKCVLLLFNVVPGLCTCKESIPPTELQSQPQGYLFTWANFLFNLTT